MDASVSPPSGQPPEQAASPDSAAAARQLLIAGHAAAAQERARASYRRAPGFVLASYALFLLALAAGHWKLLQLLAGEDGPYMLRLYGGMAGGVAVLAVWAAWVARQPLLASPQTILFSQRGASFTALLAQAVVLSFVGALVADGGRWLADGIYSWIAQAIGFFLIGLPVFNMLAGSCTLVDLAQREVQLCSGRPTLLLRRKVQVTPTMHLKVLAESRGRTSFDMFSFLFISQWEDGLIDFWGLTWTGKPPVFFYNLYLFEPGGRQYQLARIREDVSGANHIAKNLALAFALPVPDPNFTIT